MRGMPSTDFPFEVKPERTSHTRLRQARKARLAEQEVDNLVQSDTESDREVNEPVMADNTKERLLSDYGRENSPGIHLTIVNQPVNVANFQLHPTTI